jgi:hypothetical protein
MTPQSLHTEDDTWLCQLGILQIHSSTMEIKGWVLSRNFTAFPTLRDLPDENYRNEQPAGTQSNIMNTYRICKHNSCHNTHPWQKTQNSGNRQTSSPFSTNAVSKAKIRGHVYNNSTDIMTDHWFQSFPVWSQHEPFLWAMCSDNFAMIWINAFVWKVFLSWY